MPASAPHASSSARARRACGRRSGSCSQVTWTRSSGPAFPHPSVYRTAAAWSAPLLLDRHDDASSAGASTGGARAPSLRTCRALALAVLHAMLSAVAASPTLLQQVASAQDCNWQRALSPSGRPHRPSAMAASSGARARRLHSCRGAPSSQLPAWGAVAAEGRGLAAGSDPARAHERGRGPLGVALRRNLTPSRAPAIAPSRAAHRWAPLLCTGPGSWLLCGCALCDRARVGIADRGRSHSS